MLWAWNPTKSVTKTSSGSCLHSRFGSSDRICGIKGYWGLGADKEGMYDLPPVAQACMSCHLRLRDSDNAFHGESTKLLLTCWRVQQPMLFIPCEAPIAASDKNQIASVACLKQFVIKSELHFGWCHQPPIWHVRADRTGRIGKDSPLFLTSGT